ncbi:hypothetical protein MD484_g274, partial [Candolleomyces efflorescens]
MSESDTRPQDGASGSIDILSSLLRSTILRKSTAKGPPTTPPPTASRKPQSNAPEPLDTPHHDSVDQSSIDPVLEELKGIIEKELGRSIVQLPEDSKFASSLYHRLASASEIKVFRVLEETEVYNTECKRWNLPRESTSPKPFLEAAIYEPLANMIKAILSRFQTGANARKREVVDTHLMNMYHKEAVATNTFSRPDISIKAKGPSFQLPHREPPSGVGVGFSNMATCFEIKVQSQSWAPMKVLLQVAVYARQIFIQQPNRQFVRVLLLTEETFRLFHFDRSGVQYTQDMNIHEETDTFIRLVLGLSSCEESDLGLDKSIQWKRKKGLKVSGFLKTRNGDSIKTYQLANIEPIFSHFNLCGRSGTCWSVLDLATGKKYVVKDTWELEGRVSEIVHMKELKGAAGVVQMVSYEEKRNETKCLRDLEHIASGLSPGEFHNRILMRVVLDSHGRSIKEFNSPAQLLGALSDAISGLEQISEHSIIHRGVTAHSILLGQADADVGYRGLIFDFEMSVVMDAQRPILTEFANLKSGCQMYDSAMILLAATSRAPYSIGHSYLDDLEAFAYVYAHIIYEYDRDGTRYGVDTAIRKWELESGYDAGMFKEGFLARRDFMRDENLRDRWPRACRELLIQLCAMLEPLHKKKIHICHQKPGSKSRTNQVQRLMKQKDQHYQSIKKLFDDAIVALAREEEEILQSLLSSSSDGSQYQRRSSPAIFPLPWAWPPNNRGIPALIQSQQSKRPSEDFFEPDAKRQYLGVPFRRDNEPSPEPTTPTVGGIPPQEDFFTRVLGLPEPPAEILGLPEPPEEDHI